MKEDMLTLSEASKMLGLHPKTLQRMDRKGVLKARRTRTNRRYYTIKDLREFRRFQVLQARTDLVDEIIDAVVRFETVTENLMKPVQI